VSVPFSLARFLLSVRRVYVALVRRNIARYTAARVSATLGSARGVDVNLQYQILTTGQAGSVGAAARIRYRQ